MADLVGEDAIALLLLLLFVVGVFVSVSTADDDALIDEVV
jgi:hypothetical protein